MPHLKTAPFPSSIIPIVLANCSNLTSWPQSRIRNPIQFQRQFNSFSLFQRTLSNIETILGHCPIIVTTAAAQCERTHAQLDEMSSLGPVDVVVEPIERGNWPAAISAALVAMERYPEHHLVFFDAACPVQNTDALTRLLHQTLGSSFSNEHIVLAGEPNFPFTAGDSVVVERAERHEDPLLFSFRPSLGTGVQSNFRIGHLGITQSGSFLKWAGDIDLQSVETCARALRGATPSMSGFWPNMNIWSTLQESNLSPKLLESHPNVVLRPVELDPITEPTQSNTTGRSVVEMDCENCEVIGDGRLVAVAGCENIQVKITADATFIFNKNHPDSLTKILAELRKAERFELFDSDTRQTYWGEQCLVEQRPGYAINRLIVQPGEKIPLHLHAQRAENWHVVSGSGIALLGNKSVPMEAGTSMEIMQQVPHTCINTGSGPLVIVETQRGSFLSETDVRNLEEGQLLTQLAS